MERPLSHDEYEGMPDLGRMDEPTLDLGGGGAPGEPSAAAPARRYVILERLGEGGSGVVYTAFDLRLNRKVALKVLRREENAHARARFVREAQALARLNHPNVVAAFDAGTVGERPYLAMELIEGKTLAAWLAERPRGWREILSVYLQAGAGLAAVHDAGLVHRDFKPSNALIGSDGRVRIVDLGLARLTGATVAPEAGSESPSGDAFQDKLTVEGDRIGTPGYSAPEQRGGAAVDARADVYAFSVSLAEALRVARRSRVPGWVWRAVWRGQSRDPAERHASLAELLRELSLERWKRRRFAIAAAVATLGLAVAGGTWVSRADHTCEVSEAQIWTRESAGAVARAFAATGLPYAERAFAAVDRSLGAYAAAWHDQRVDACLETRVRRSQSEDVLDRRVACLDGRRAAARALVTVLADADRTAVDQSAAAAAKLPELARCADRDYVMAQVKPPEPGVAGEVTRLNARLGDATARYRAGQYHAAEERLRAMLADVERTGYAPLAANVYYTLGSVQNWSGEAALAPSNLTRAYFAAREGGDEETAAAAAIELIDAYGFELLDFGHANVWAAHARAEVVRSAMGTRLEADLQLRLGLLAERQGNGAEALADYRQSLAILRQLHEADGPMAARLHTHIAAELEYGGRFAEAIASLGSSLKLRAELATLSHPDNVNTLALLSLDYAETGPSAAALDYALAGVAVADSMLGTHPKTGLAHLALAMALEELDDDVAALEELEHARSIFEATRPPGHPNLGLVHTSIGVVLARLGRTEEALRHARHGYDVYRHAFGERHQSSADSLAKVGNVLLLGGRPADALEALTRAVAVLDEVNPDGQGTPAALVTMGKCLLALGRLDEARVAAERALRVARAQGLGPRIIAETEGLRAEIPRRH